MPLHIIEELLDALEDSEPDSNNTDLTEAEETVLAVGNAVLGSGVKRKTMRLCG